MAQTLGNVLEGQLIRAIRTKNELEIRKTLLHHSKANVNYLLNDCWLSDRSDFPSQTLLHVAASLGCVPITTFLLNVGANPNVFDMHDNTPLHLACQKGETGTIRALLQHHADINLKNASNQVPWETNFKRKQMQNLVETLQSRIDELSEMESLPFSSDLFVEHAKSLKNHAPMWEVLDLLIEYTPFESPEEEQAVKERRVAWIDGLADLKIETLRDLSTTEHLTWASDLEFPVVYEYGMHVILGFKADEIREEIRKLESTCPVRRILLLANESLSGKYSELELEAWENYFGNNEVRHLSELQSMHESIWVDMEMPQDFKDALRTVVDWFEVLTSKPFQGDHTIRPENEIILRLPEIVSCATFHETCLYVATMTGYVYIWSATHRDHLHTIRLEYPLEDERGRIRVKHEQITHMVFPDDNSSTNVLTASVDGFIAAWNLKSSHPNLQGKCVQRWLTHHGNIREMIVPERSENVFSIGSDGYLRVRNLKYDGQVIHTFRRSDNSLTCMAELSVSKVILGSDDGCILQVDIRTQSTSDMIELPGREPIRCITVDKENELVFFVFDEFHIGLVDLSSWCMIGKFCESMGRHLGIVNGIEVRQNLVWTSSEDNTFRAWDVQFLRNLPDDTPKSVKFLDDKLYRVLEVWECMKLHPPDLKNGIQCALFCGNSDLILTSFGRVVVSYDLSRMDDILEDKRDRVLERHSQLLLQESALFPAIGPVEIETKKEGKGKKGKK